MRYPLTYILEAITEVPDKTETYLIAVKQKY
jgi:hypothetical protein